MNNNEMNNQNGQQQLNNTNNVQSQSTQFQIPNSNNNTFANQNSSLAKGNKWKTYAIIELVLIGIVLIGVFLTLLLQMKSKNMNNGDTGIEWLAIFMWFCILGLVVPSFGAVSVLSIKTYIEDKKHNKMSILRKLIFMFNCFILVLVFLLVLYYIVFFYIL